MRPQRAEVPFLRGGRHSRMIVGRPGGDDRQVGLRAARVAPGLRGRTTMSSPVAMRLQLRVELKRLRLQAGLTQKYVADTLDWSPSKVIRIENGQVAIGVSDLRALTSLYGMTDDGQLRELEQLARGSKRLPFSEYRDVIS